MGVVSHDASTSYRVTSASRSTYIWCSYGVLPIDGVVMETTSIWYSYGVLPIDGVVMETTYRWCSYEVYL